MAKDTKSSGELRDRFHAGPRRTYFPAWPGVGEPPEDATTLRDLKRVHGFAREGLERFATRRAEVLGDERLSEVGRAEALRDVAKAETLRNLRQLRAKALEPTRQVLAKRRAELAPVRRREPEDAAGQLADMEVRQYLRGLEPEKRQEALLRAGPEVAEAVLRGAAPELSGVTAATTGLLEKRLLGERHGAELEDLAELEEGLRAAEQALEIAEREVRELSGLTRAEVAVLDSEPEEEAGGA